MSHYIYINGSILPENMARISVLDHSFLYGIGVFETLRAYNGKIAFLDDHIHRLYRSLESIHLTISPAKKDLYADIYKTLNKNNLKNAYIRITVSMGEGEPGLDPDFCPKPTIVIYVKKCKEPVSEWYTKGVPVSVVSIIKPKPGNIKTPVKSCNFLYNYLAKREAKLKGAVEGIMLSQNRVVTEGSVSNIFMVHENGLFTPPAGEDVLDGITRKTVIEIAKKRGISVSETGFRVNELKGAKECFITNTGFEVLPVSSVDGDVIGEGRPGKMTLMLAEEYKKKII